MRIIWNLIMRARADGCTGLAAMVAYDFFVVLPAVLIFMVSALTFLPIDNLSRSITDQFVDVLPADALSLMERIIDQTLERGEKQFYLLLTSLALALYVMNSGYAGLISSLNRVYRLEEKRKWLKVRLRALIMSVTAAGLIVATFVMILLAPPIANALSDDQGALEVVALTISYIRWPVIIGLAFLGMESTYKYAPCGGPRWRFVSPGTLFGTGAWVAATLAFGFYVNHFGSYDKIYGALGAVIVILTWMWMSALIFLVGAEINMLWKEKTSPSV